MKISLKKATEIHKRKQNRVIVATQDVDFLTSNLISKDSKKYISAQIKKGIISGAFQDQQINQYFICSRLTEKKVPQKKFTTELKEIEEKGKALEKLRLMGYKIHKYCNENGIQHIDFIDLNLEEEDIFAVLEGLCLSSYQFLKYKNIKKENSLQSVTLFGAIGFSKQISDLQYRIESVVIAKDLVNEPLSYLTAVQFSKDIEKLSRKDGFKFQALQLRQIQSLKMGGILGVNRGSPNPPTFNILEWKPKNRKNTKPMILVGKGIVYDTGGLSLKPTANSMDAMKSDMSGAATVTGVFHYLAKAKLPLWVIGLIPATENRPGEDAYTPGDILNMHDGTTVEVLNTDAEGRLVLADSLSYAKKYNPLWVMDFATLTGSASRAIGPEGVVCMGTIEEDIKNELKDSGIMVHERLVEFPLWDEYKVKLDSDIADMKNIGGPAAGAITAGKFLEHFTDYPWFHFDIAGSAFLRSESTYRGKNASGIGIRLMINFLKKQCQ